MKKGDLWWCDLSPTTGNEACGLRLCKILKILQDDLVIVLPYYPIGGNRYEPMIEHKRTISIKRLEEKWEKDKIVVCKVKEGGDNLKDDLILFRCEKEEKQQIKRDAERHGKTISDFIRYLVANERKERENK